MLLFVLQIPVSNLCHYEFCSSQSLFQIKVKDIFYDFTNFLKVFLIIRPFLKPTSYKICPHCILIVCPTTMPFGSWAYHDNKENC